MIIVTLRASCLHEDFQDVHARTGRATGTRRH